MKAVDIVLIVCGLWAALMLGAWLLSNRDGSGGYGDDEGSYPGWEGGSGDWDGVADAGAHGGSGGCGGQMQMQGFAPALEDPLYKDQPTPHPLPLSYLSSNSLYAREKLLATSHSI